MSEVLNGEFWNGRQPKFVMGGTRILLDKIINDNEYPGYIIKFAQQLKLREYIHPKEFFLTLSKYENLEFIETGVLALEWFKRSNSNWNMYHANGRNILAITLLLAKAEGESILEQQELMQYAMNLLGLIIIHKNHLDGVIVAKYDNFTILGSNRNFFDAIKKDNKEEPPSENNRGQ